MALPIKTSGSWNWKHKQRRDEYGDNDRLLENIIQPDREAQVRRRQNHDADPQVDDGNERIMV